MIMLNEWVKLWNNGWFNTTNKIKYCIGGWEKLNYSINAIKRLTEKYSRILVRIKTDRDVAVSFDLNEIRIGDCTIFTGNKYDVYLKGVQVHTFKYYREVVKYINEII